MDADADVDADVDVDVNMDDNDDARGLLINDHLKIPVFAPFYCCYYLAINRYLL
jgi:hypothetical protein